jgi:acyl carrier protein
LDTKYSVDEVAERLVFLIRSVLNLQDDIELTKDSDLLADVGIDSIEGFELIAALHGFIEVDIPEDMNPAIISSVTALAQFVLENYEIDKISRIMADDFEEALKAYTERTETEDIF